MLTRTLRHRAGRAERAGDLVAAIDAWSDLVRRRPDPGTEERLAELRIEALDGYDTGATTPVLPVPNDPFPGLVGAPPEVVPADLDAPTLGGALQHHGCLLVRGLLGPATANELAEAVDRAFVAREATDSADDRAAPWFAPCRAWDARRPDKAAAARKWAQECATMQVVDSPRALRLVTDALVGTGLVGAVADYLGERPVLSINKTTLRRVPPDARTAWHQDGAFMGAETRAIDVWVALTDCGSGTDAPGLHLMPRRLDGIVDYGTPGAAHPYGVSPAVVAEIGGAITPCTPRFAAGDALVFDQLFLHSTGGDVAGLTRSRMALEAWLFAPTTFPSDYLPLYV